MFLFGLVTAHPNGNVKDLLPTEVEENINEEHIEETSDINEHINNAGKGSRSVTAIMLKYGLSDNTNMVFSPFGFSSILTMLSDGSRSETLKEIITVLGHSNNNKETHEDYKDVFKRLNMENPQVAPQFKTWFYIYKNYTVSESYKNLLKEAYNVEVKVGHHCSFN